GWAGYTATAVSGAGNRGLYFYQDASVINPSNPSATSSGTTNNLAQIQFEMTFTGTPCSGTPNAGTAFGPAGVCANAPFTLHDTGYTAVPGILFQWESSLAGSGIWDTIPGAYSPFLVVSTGITQAMDYRFRVTCSNGGGVTVSNAVSVGINPPTQCYCIPYSGSSTSSDIIARFQLDTINNYTGATNTNGYSDFTNMIANAAIGVPTTATVTGYTGSGN